MVDIGVTISDEVSILVFTQLGRSQAPLVPRFTPAECVRARVLSTGYVWRDNAIPAAVNGA
jgi:hypothetical protein